MHLWCVVPGNKFWKKVIFIKFFVWKHGTVWPLLSFCSSCWLSHPTVWCWLLGPMEHLKGARAMHFSKTFKQQRLSGFSRSLWGCCEGGSCGGPRFPCYLTSVDTAWINTTGLMARSVEVNCLGARTENAHCPGSPDRVFSSLGLASGWRGSLVFSHFPPSCLD